MSALEGLPVWNAALAAIIIMLVARYWFRPAEEVPLPDTTPEPVVFQTFTPSTLKKYNGIDDPKVLLAVKGRVFDCTAGKKFYGPGGPYENFAGHDASRGLAKNSFDVDMITPDGEPIDLLEDLDKHEKQALDEWFVHFEGKYTLCGELVNEEKHQ